MTRAVFIVICALIAVAASNVIQPYDLVEEAEKQLQQLKTLVQGRILLADDDIQDLYNDFRQYSRDEIYDADIAIRQQLQTIDGQISQIKNLAQSAGKDVSSCTDVREEAISELSATRNEEINTCVGVVLAEGLKVTRDAKYYVDIIMNRVHNVENQFRSCNGNIVCISPLLTQIELYQISLIQEIRTEIAAIDGLLLTLKLSSKTCADQGIAAFVAESSTIVGEITSCVNVILG